MKIAEIINLVRVRFPGQSEPGVFLASHVPMEYGQRVVAMSERGLTIGFINSQVYETIYAENMGKILTITKLATDKDVLKFKDSYQKQREAWKIFNQLITENNLPMNLENVEFTSEGKKIVFYYSAPTRVDFRELLKALSNELKLRIELKQIFDNNTQISEVGPCGPDLCLFINSVSNKSPQGKKCSESFCCLENNDLFYEDKKSRLPKNYSLIATTNGETGKVLSLDFVKEEFEMLTDQGIVKRYTSELYKETLNKKTTLFPNKFEIISYQNKIVVGKEKSVADLQHQKDIANEESDILAKAFSEQVWRDFN